MSKYAAIIIFAIILFVGAIFFLRGGTNTALPLLNRPNNTYNQTDINLPDNEYIDQELNALENELNSMSDDDFSPDKLME